MRGILPAALAALSLTLSPQQTFRVNVDAVRVDVLVMDRNRPVAATGAMRSGRSRTYCAPCAQHLARWISSITPALAANGRQVRRA